MLFGLTVLAVIMPSTGSDFNPFHWAGRLAAGQSIEISNVYGSIRAEASLDDRADVTTQQPGARIAMVQTGQGIMFRVVPTGSDARADFTVRVPKGVHFIGRTVNGSVDAESLKGDAAGYTVNGNVHISTTGEGRAQTVNGSIQATVGQMHSGALEFSAVNGGIVLDLPCRMSATVHAHTSHGGIHSDFPLAIEGHSGERLATGRVGRGGPDLRLTTINGNIRVRRF